MWVTRIKWTTWVSLRAHYGQYPTGDFGPGFGAAVALFRIAGVPLQWSGQMASLCLGLGLIYLCFALANRLYGSTAGLVMALLVAVHAGFVDSSIGGMAENGLLVGLIGGVLLLVSAGDRPSARRAVLAGSAAGLLFGFAYLVRPDGALFGVVLCTAWFILASRVGSDPVRGRQGACAALAVIVLVVGLNTLAIWRETGEVRPHQRRMGLASVYDADSPQAAEQALFEVWSGGASGSRPQQSEPRGSRGAPRPQRPCGLYRWPS